MPAPTRPLEFGWFLPTRGDTDDYSDPLKVAAGIEMFTRVAKAAEGAGFEYMLIPVGHQCWDAYMTGALMAGQTSKMRMLIAARPGYINPVLMAKMISTFDQLTGGRIAVNLIAGQSEQENIAEGIRWSKEERYEVMEEEVSILKALWTQGEGRTTWNGKYHTLKDAELTPKPLQKPYPKFYLGGGSQQAWELSAKHTDVHLFWGDTYETISENTEAEAWDAAEGLVRNVGADRENYILNYYANSAANRRVQELRAKGDLIAPNLWVGLAKARPGAGVVIVGNPQQCADVLQNYIDIGCHSFCLSGYLHDAEAERFAKWVRPLLVERNEGRMKPLAA